MRRWNSRIIGGAAPAAACNVLVVVAVLSGCQPQRRPFFAPYRPALVWPAPPMAPKIRYVGEIRSSDDLHSRRTAWRSLSEFFIGKDPPAVLYGPRAVLSLADEGRLWVADPGGRCLHLFNLQTRRYTRITSVGDSRLLTPVGLTRGPEGSIYVCDAQRAAIYRLAGRTGEFLGEITLHEVLRRPVALYYEPAAEELFVVDTAAHNIKVLGPDGAVRRIIGRRGTAPGEFNFPLAITGYDGTIWVVDTGNQRIQGLLRSGDPVITFGRPGDSPGDLALPKGIAADRRGHLYVVDARFENVQVFDRQGRLLLFFGEEGVGPGEFWLPAGIDIDANDRIWVCDLYNRRLQVFDYVGSDVDAGTAKGP